MRKRIGGCITVLLMLAMGLAGCARPQTAPQHNSAPTPHPTAVYSGTVYTPEPEPLTSEERFENYLATYREQGFYFAMDDLNTAEAEFREDDTLCRLMLETAQGGESFDDRLACLLWLASRDYEILVAEKGTSGYDSQEYAHGALYGDITDAARALFDEMIAHPETFDAYRYEDTDISHVSGIGLGGKYEVTAVAAMNGDAARMEEMLSLLSAQGWPEADYQELLQPFTDFLLYNPQHTRALMPQLLEKGADAGTVFSYLLGNSFADADANIALAHEFMTGYYGQSTGIWDDQQLYALEFRVAQEDISLDAYVPQSVPTGTKGKTVLVVLPDGEFYQAKLSWFAQSEERSACIPLEYMPVSLEDLEMVLIIEESFEKTVEYTGMSGTGGTIASGYARIDDIYAYEYPSGGYIGKVGQVRSEPPYTATISGGTGAVYADFDTEGVIACIVAYLGG